MSKVWAEKFKVYHRKNPHIYEAFEKLSLQVSKTRSNFAVRNIFGKLRWDSAIRGDDNFKINENYSAYYGRLFEHRNPHLNGFFRKKNILPTD